MKPKLLILLWLVVLPAFLPNSLAISCSRSGKAESDIHCLTAACDSFQDVYGAYPSETNWIEELTDQPSVIPCDLMKAVLEGSGIDCMIKNERGSAIAGQGWAIPGNPTLVWAWPEVLVNDEDFEEASRIVTDFQKSEETKKADEHPTTCS